MRAQLATLLPDGGTAFSPCAPGGVGTGTEAAASPGWSIAAGGRAAVGTAAGPG